MSARHEHSAGCWPGGERDLECPIVRGYNDRRRAVHQEIKAWRIVKHVLAMENDPYLCGHPEWVAICEEARAALNLKGGAA
jgi:hypothetical protein